MESNINYKIFEHKPKKNRYILNNSFVVKFESEDKTMQILCDDKTPVGKLHDFIMNVKGHLVDRIAKEHKKEEEEINKQKEPDKKEEN